MEEKLRKRTGEQESGLPKIMVCDIKKNKMKLMDFVRYCDSGVESFNQTV